MPVYKERSFAHASLSLRSNHAAMTTFESCELSIRYQSISDIGRISVFARLLIEFRSTCANAPERQPCEGGMTKNLLDTDLLSIFSYPSPWLRYSKCISLSRKFLVLLCFILILANFQPGWIAHGTACLVTACNNCKQNSPGGFPPETIAR